MALSTSAFSMVLADYIGSPHCNGQCDIFSKDLLRWVPPFLYTNTISGGRWL